MDSEKLRALIEETVTRRLEGPLAPAPQAANKRAEPEQPAVITRDDVEKITFGGVLKIPRGAIVTAMAREIASDKQIRITTEDAPAQSVALGADHGGFELKEQVKAFLQQLGYEVRDLGTHDTTPVDYPDIALAVAMSVARKECTLGIIVDGAGIGSCMAANKVPGVRAALCYDEATARNSREHNFANVLTLGGKMIKPDAMRRIVKTWLETPFGEERHARRVRKITAIEAKYIRNPVGE
jgi:ribose 5-phosphate isomerase B